MCKRCDWATKNEVMKKYHDEEWGVPLHDEQKLFEFLLLEIFQAGLSWQTVLNKRESFRKAFDNFNPELVQNYKAEKIAELMSDKTIIRNRMKIEASVNNAKRYLEIQKEFGSFDCYIWSFVQHKTIYNTFNSMDELPSKTPLSDTISSDLKKRGFKFVGSTIIYAFMQAIGLVNDHLTSCFKYKSM